MAGVISATMVVLSMMTAVVIAAAAVTAAAAAAAMREVFTQAHTRMLRISMCGRAGMQTQQRTVNLSKKAM